MQKDEKWQKMMVVREKVARELVATEVTYCNAIKSVVTEFLKPAESILKKQYITEIFSNIDQLQSLHSNILEDLQKCVESWEEESCIAAVFMTLVPYLKLYKAYCANYNGAVLRVSERSNSSHKFASLLQAKKETVGFDLCSLLIQPIQRIPRYRLLFEELLKHTPPEHPDYAPISNTLVSIQEVAKYVNESVRAKENQDKLLQIQESLTGCKTPIVSLSRIFIREGVLVKMCRREPKRRYLFLFNDLLVYCSSNEGNQTYTFHRAMGLSQLRVDDIPDNSGMSNAFQILSNQKSFSVFAESAQDKKSWMADINKAIQLCYQLHHKQATGKDADPDDIAPVWIPDKLLKNCMLCDVKFTTINRRHHCRKCGKLVCGACSGKKYKLENMGKVCRVCDECFDVLSGTTSKATPKGSRLSVAGGTIQSLHDTAEAQKNLAKRATQKFGVKDDKPENTFTASFIPADTEEELSSLSSNTTENTLSADKSSIKESRKPRKKKTKKKKIRRRNTITDMEETASPRTVSREPSEESEDSDVPEFAPPAPPPPSVNAEGFFEFDSDDEDISDEYLPPPDRDPPSIPCY